jgi:hypothetical protein
MKTTLLTTILSAAVLSAAVLAPVSAQACGCQRQVYVAPPVVDNGYAVGGDFYTYDGAPQVVITYPYGFWGGGWYAGRYFESGYWYGNRRYDREIRGGERFYDRGGERGVIRGGERGGVRSGGRHR